MAENNSTTRRTILKVSGAVGATAFLAGCADDNGNDDENDDDDPAPDENDNDEADVEDWEDVDEIMLDGITSGWVGMEPDVIADEENPTLVLFEGESYDITWENGDGAQHNIEIVDEDDEVVDDLETDNMDEEGETQTLEVDEVTDEMAEYVCRPHETQMRGEIDVQELSLIHIS
ncbi:blue (type 1) copper domain-containing protein, partial [Natrialba chahannaoensis JCM 10990]